VHLIGVLLRVYPTKNKELDMKEFLINNAGAIGSWIGVVIIVLLFLSNKHWIESKWSYPILMSTLVLGMLKFIDVCEAIAKFLAK
jgi:hypothetical protein